MTTYFIRATKSTADHVKGYVKKVELDRPRAPKGWRVIGEARTTVSGGIACLPIRRARQ